MWFYIVILLALCYYYLKTNYNYWKHRGLDCPKYYFLVGNLWEQFTFKKNVAVVMQDAYRKFKGYNYIGFYNALQPAILLRNPEIISDVLVKDFSSFCDNDFDIDEVADPVFGKNPFILKGNKWKRTRAQATPLFTSGKTKIMMPLINETCTKLLNHLNENHQHPIELFHLAKQITAENVASCAFGLEGNNFIDKNAQFMEIAHQLINPTPWNILKGFMIFLCPSLARIISIRFFAEETVTYLRQIVEQTMKYRAENHIQRNDFLDEMKRLKDKINDESVFNILDILGHSGGFLLDGMLTSSSVISNFIYVLAKHPNVQEKARIEVQDMMKNNNNELTYENIKDMEYLECVFKESLRQNPPLMYMTRRVTKRYRMKPMREDGSGPCVELEVGTPVIIPSYALHNSEEFYDEPQKFNPERWRSENKENIVKHTFLPFSEGPRVCLGMKFGILQTKMVLISILNNYRLVLNGKTSKQPEIDPKSFLNLPVGGYWVDFIKL